MSEFDLQILTHFDQYLGIQCIFFKTDFPLKLFNSNIYARFHAELPFHSVSVTPEDAPPLVLTTHGMKTSSTCSVVLLAGHHLQNIQGVLDMVDTMSSSMLRIPYAMVLLVEKGGTVPDIPHVSIPTAVVS